MILFNKVQLRSLADDIEFLRASVTDTEEPAYCLLSHALEDVLLIEELFEL